MKNERRKIRLTYAATGESVVAEMLDDEAPNVCEYVWSRLPIETKAIHGMYSGLEVFAMLDKPEPVPNENMVQLPLPGELLYFYNPQRRSGRREKAGGRSCAGIWPRRDVACA